MSKEQNKFGHLIDEATKTPRTLSETKSYTDLEYAVMYKNRCEKLEAELADARAEIERLRAKLRKLEANK